MLDHYLVREELNGGGVLGAFVSVVQGLSYDGFIANTDFRLETVTRRLRSDRVLESHRAHIRAGCGNRTRDHMITSQVLYQLS